MDLRKLRGLIDRPRAESEGWYGLVHFVQPRFFTVRFLASQLGAIYTVPAGKVAIVMNARVYNSTAGTVIVEWHRLRVGEAGPTVANKFSRLSAAATSTAPVDNFPPFLAGETLHVVAAANVDAYFVLVEFDPLIELPGCTLRSERVSGLTVAEQSLYTVPAGKIAHTMILAAPMNARIDGLLRTYNGGAATRFGIFRLKRGNDTQTVARISTGANFRGLEGGHWFEAGDEVRVASDVNEPNMNAFIDVIERAV